MTEPQPESADPAPPTSAPPRQRGGPNTDVTVFRVGELERRMGEMDSKLADVQTRVVRIESALENKATKEQVYMLGAVTAGIALLTLLVHVVLRFLSV